MFTWIKMETGYAGWFGGRAVCTVSRSSFGRDWEVRTNAGTLLTWAKTLSEAKQWASVNRKLFS